MMHVVYLAQGLAHSKCSIHVSCYYCCFLKLATKSLWGLLYIHSWHESTNPLFCLFILSSMLNFWISNYFTIFSKLKPGYWERDYIVRCFYSPFSNRILLVFIMFLSFIFFLVYCPLSALIFCTIIVSGKILTRFKSTSSLTDYMTVIY